MATPIVEPALGAGPVDTTASPPVVISGMTYSLGAPNGGSFGNQPGSVVIRYDGVALNSTVVQWQSQFTQFTAPRANLVDTIPATLSIVLADGTVQNEVPILFAPPQPATVAQNLSAATRGN